MPMAEPLLMMAFASARRSCGTLAEIIGTLSIANAGNLTLIYIGSLLAGAGCASFFSSAYSPASSEPI
jgi:hypothetical protein